LLDSTDELLHESGVELDFNAGNESGQVVTNADSNAQAFGIQHRQQRKSLVRLLLEFEPLLQDPTGIANVGECPAEFLKRGWIGRALLQKSCEFEQLFCLSPDPAGRLLGREGEGLHELTRKRCDFLVSLPTTGPVRSLNVSVAAGVMLFEAVRQRRARSS